MMRSSRVLLVGLLCALAAVLVTKFVMSTQAQSLINKMPQVATKVAEFSEDDNVSSLEFSPDGTRLAVSTFFKLHVNLWAWQGRPSIARTLLKPPSSAPYLDGDGLRYSPDGRWLAVRHGAPVGRSDSSPATIFDVTSGAVVASIPEPIGGGAWTRIAFSPDGRFFIRTYDAPLPPERYQFIVHDTSDWRVSWGLRTLPLYAMALAISPDGKRAAIGGLTLGPGVAHDAQIQIIDMDQRKVVKVISSAFPFSQVEMLAWSTDSLHIAAGANGGSKGGQPPPPEPVKIFDTTDGTVVSTEASVPVTISGLHYTADKRYFIDSGDAPKWGVKIWDADHKKLLQEIQAERCYAIAVSRDGRLLAVDDRKSVSVWELR